MTRRSDSEDGGVNEALTRLWDGIRTPDESDLDAVARSATVGSRDFVELEPSVRTGPRVLRPSWAFAIAVIALLAGSGLGFSLGSSLTPSGNAAPPGVTMGFVRFYDPGCRCYKARVSGRVSSVKAGEYVVVLEEFCGRGSGRSVVAATTGEGGGWEAVIDGVIRPDSDIAVSYRARWEDELSEAVTFRGRLSVTGVSRSGERQVVSVVTPDHNPVNLKGRKVILQRRVGGQWTRIANARLAPHGARFYTFTATFPTVGRGWTVRALVPSNGAAPCFSAQLSAPWVS